MRTPSLSRASCYVSFLAILVFSIVLYTSTSARSHILGFLTPHAGHKSWLLGSKKGAQEDTNIHPIDHLISLAQTSFDFLKAAEAHSLHAAAAHYRKKRGRRPPPGFEAWYEYATSRNAVIIESFWDQIYEDLAPFWSVEPALLRKITHVFSPKVSVREGKVEAQAHDVYEKLDAWVDMFRTLAEDVRVRLPDVDIPLNVNDEPALLVPWETVDTAISMARRILVDPKDVVTNYTGFESIEELTANFTFDPEWLGPQLTHPASHLGPRPLWSLVRPACPPWTTARKEHVLDDIWDSEGETSLQQVPATLLPLELPESSHKGYASSWINATDSCEWPNGQGLHSAFVAPKAMSVSRKLLLLFGDSKLSMSSEILIPGAQEWTATNSGPSNSTLTWAEKPNKLFWRGLATQGREPQRYWRRFQRHRLVSMLNATHVEIAEASIHSGNESTVGCWICKHLSTVPSERVPSQNSG
jgi:hypothetical protein